MCLINVSPECLVLRILSSGGFCRVGVNLLYYKTLSQIIHRAELKILSTRCCCPSDTPQFFSLKLIVKVPDEGEQLYTSNRENSSHSHIQILQLHSAQNFCFYLRGICVVHAQLQSSIILPKDNEAIVERNIHNKAQESAFPKREMSKFSGCQPQHSYQ